MSSACCITGLAPMTLSPSLRPLPWRWALSLVPSLSLNSSPFGGFNISLLKRTVPLSDHFLLLQNYLCEAFLVSLDSLCWQYDRLMVGTIAHLSVRSPDWCGDRPLVGTIAHLSARSPTCRLDRPLVGSIAHLSVRSFYGCGDRPTHSFKIQGAGSPTIIVNNPQSCKPAPTQQ